MVFDYSRMAELAVAQIADKGRTVSLVHKIQGTFEPSDSTFSGQSEVAQSVTMAIVDYNKDDVDGTLIKSSDKLALLAPETNLIHVPNTGDIVTDGSDDYSIENVNTVSPGATVVLYKLQLRR